MPGGHTQASPAGVGREQKAPGRRGRRQQGFGLALPGPSTSWEACLPTRALAAQSEAELLLFPLPRWEHQVLERLVLCPQADPPSPSKRQRCSRVSTPAVWTSVALLGEGVAPLAPGHSGHP